MPRFIQLFLRRRIVSMKLEKYRHCWPIHEDSVKPPENWQGWPDKKEFAFVLTHDVDAKSGLNKCYQLAAIEKKYGFRSSFNFVPEKYQVPDELRHYLVEGGFEIGLHGLKHDGKLYKTQEIFRNRAIAINRYLKEWNSSGFRSPAMHQDLNWLHDLDIEYDASTFDTDPFEPQSSGMCTIFPFLVRKDTNEKGYVELPYTLPQDFTLFIIMKQKDIDIWKKKLNWIVKKGGMALLNTHPNNMNFNNGRLKIEEYTAELYIRFLEYVYKEYKNKYWHVLPLEVSRFWRDMQYYNTIWLSNT